MRKLTADIAKAIYQDMKAGEKQVNTALKYGISGSLVSKIKLGEAWPYATGFKRSPTIEELADGKEFRPVPGYTNRWITVDGVVIASCRGKFTIMEVYTKINGYLYVGGNIKGKGKIECIHRLLCLTFKADSYFEGAEVRHLDGNPLNNKLDNLKWGTREENMEDMVLHGRSCRGERHGASKLTKEKVKVVRDMLEEGLTEAVIASHFNVHPRTIQDIESGKNWSWLT